jgi:hypothetical protein
VRAVLALVVIALAVAGLLALHIEHRPAYIVVHKGQPMPRHYIEAWSFGNYTIVEVEPSSTTVTLAPWS